MNKIVLREEIVSGINLPDVEINRIYEECKSRWGLNDEPMDAFFRYPKWLNKMPLELSRIVNSLMSGFDFYTHRNVNKSLALLHEKLQRENGIDFDNTIYCILPNKEGRINSSYEYLLEYKMINKLSKHVVVPNLKGFPYDKLDDIKNIVFIDDFCGTGKTFVDYISSIENLIQGKSIYYLVVHIMEKALSRIRELEGQKDFKIYVIYQVCTCKAFERGIEPKDRRGDYKHLAVEYGLSSKNIFGYYDTEALVSFYNDTPNNTLEVFWMDTKENKALFPRNNDEKPGWKKLNKKKELRKESNYLNGCNK